MTNAHGSYLKINPWPNTSVSLPVPRKEPHFVIDLYARGARTSRAPRSPRDLDAHPLAGRYMKCIYRDDWQGVGELMLSSANKLAKIGADFLICPDNTIHQALPYIEAQLPLKWLHIADAVAAQAAGRRFRRLGLTGTRYLVESEVYPEKLKARGLEYVRPNRTNAKK